MPVRAAGLVVIVLTSACGHLAFDTAAGDAQPDGTVTDGALDASGDGLQVTARHWVNRSNPTPGKLIGARAVYDSKRGKVILYGGDRSTGIPPTDPSAAMWAYDGTTWTSLCDPCAPGPRYAPAMAYDIARDRVVLYGGLDTTGAIDGLWEWDGTTWAAITATGLQPGRRGMAQMVYDQRRHLIVMIGGGMTPTTYDATVFEYDGVVWKAFEDATVVSVIGGQGTTALWDPLVERVEIYGDRGDQGDSDSMFSYDGMTLRLVCTACTGVARRDASMVFDPSAGRIYVIGGYVGTQGTELAGTWVRDTTGATMVSTLPSKRDSVAVAYDAGRDVIVLYGGNGAACGGNCDDTWELVHD
jgi:hypothetical protein